MPFEPIIHSDDDVAMKEDHAYAVATEHQVIIGHGSGDPSGHGRHGEDGVDLSGREEEPRRLDGSIFAKILPTGSLAATMFSTGATAVGGGILGLPSAFLESGAVIGCMWVVLIAMTTAYSLRLLAIASEITGKRSYEHLAKELLGKNGTYLISFLRFVNCFGSMIAYIMSMGDLIKPILKGAGAPEWTLDGNGYRGIVAIFWLVCYFPVTLPRRVNALRYVSTTGVLFMIYFCFCVFAHFCSHPVAKDIQLATTGINALNGIGVFMFSFVCQMNQVELYREMRPSTVARFTLSSVLICSILVGMYILVGLFGYLEFGQAMSGGTILAMFNPLKEPQFFVAFIGVFIKLMASYGLFGNVCLSAIYHTIGWDPMAVAFWKHFLLASALTVITLILGLFWPDVETVFNLVGGICGGFLGFILPSLFYMYTGNWTWRTAGIGNYVGCYILLWAGVFAVICGTATTIYNLAV